MRENDKLGSDVWPHRDEVCAPKSMAFILVVDDDWQIRDFFTDILVGDGYYVDSATSGIEAQRAIKLLRFDLMILDLSIPEIDGFEILKFARSEQPSLKVILVSGFMHDTVAKMARLLGAVACLQKPVENDTLLRTIRNILEGTEGQNAKFS